MKIKLLLPLFLLIVFSSNAFAQSVIVKPKKVVYTRKGKDIPKEKRTFEITYPVVGGAVSAPVRKTLENSVSYWRVFETSLKESMQETWLENAFYKINYNKKAILDVSLTQEGAGAYPDSHTVDLIIDLQTGKPIKFNDAFKAATAESLASLVNKKLVVEKANIIRRIDADKSGDESAEDKASIKQQVNDLQFTTENFNEFSVGDKGATIIYDAGFPHVIQALQPDGRYFFSWAQLKPFIRRDGLLARFVR